MVVLVSFALIPFRTVLLKFVHHRPSIFSWVNVYSSEMCLIIFLQLPVYQFQYHFPVSLVCTSMHEWLVG